MSPGPALSAGAAQLLSTAISSLAARGIDSARLDAEVLLAHSLGISRNTLIVEIASGRDRVVAPDAAARFQALVARRERHEPVAYLTGHREFWSLNLEVTPDVLIPRPETEHVVERALALLPPGMQVRGPRRSAKYADLAREQTTRDGGRQVRIVDVGTGSGAIAIAIACERPDVRVLALDRSAAALVVARRNARRHGVEGRIDFVQADLLEPVRGPVDAVVSNPPYIRRNELDSLMPDVRDWEPESALFDDEPGAGILGRLIEGAARVLTPGGCFIAEIADARASEALALVEDPGRWSETALAPDLAGLKRVLVTRRGER